jgi:hypothetical protein
MINVHTEPEGRMSPSGAGEKARRPGVCSLVDDVGGEGTPRLSLSSLVLPFSPDIRCMVLQILLQFHHSQRFGRLVRRMDVCSQSMAAQYYVRIITQSEPENDKALGCLCSPESYLSSGDVQKGRACSFNNLKRSWLFNSNSLCHVRSGKSDSLPQAISHSPYVEVCIGRQGCM